MRQFLMALSALILVGLSACSSADRPLSPTTPDTWATRPPQPPPTSTPEVAVMPPPVTDVSDSIPRPLVEKVKAHLANFLGITPNEIRVVESLAVSWPDTSLGCPQPGLYYAQVITPGYRFVLEASGQRYPYHTDLGEQIILCMANPSSPATEKPPILPVNPTEIQDGQPWIPVN